ncbi:sulfurtransferase [Neobacillus sp. FSL H8-0543]|uniref:sulfurtransferase n=1 Tax=Neobacillus sp. FSL H8-0543 TaxID=2954672 RepID=UPI0031581D3A
MKFIIDKEWLFNQLHESSIRIVDCRFSLADSEKGNREYGYSHLPGAVFFDLEKDLSGSVGDHGGRHPLPDIDEFVQKLERSGIDETITVVVYDQGDGAFAARFWWMLQYLGHEKVFVLDGGFNSWKEADYPVSTEIPVYEPAEFKININREIIGNVDNVRAVVNGQLAPAILIDSREERRYLGLEEPIDKKAGRIPGAINKPWIEGLHAGCYKPVEAQKQRFSEIPLDSQLFVYCGSGVTAAPNFLALKEAGFEKVKLYLGSFSDWISYQENKIE